MGSAQSELQNVLLILDDVSEKAASATDCKWLEDYNTFTVQHFSYLCSRKRDETLEPYGDTEPAFLDFTLRIAESGSAKVFYERMAKCMSLQYTFLYDFKISESGQNTVYEFDGMVATGYLVDLEESMDGSEEQMLLRCRLLLCKIAYIGSDQNGVNLIVTND